MCVVLIFYLLFLNISWEFFCCFLYPEKELPFLEIRLQKLVTGLVSSHDIGKMPEAVFHAFVLGMLATLREVYEIRSNAETGYGRADIVMRPKKEEKFPYGYVIEFKSVGKEDEMEIAAGSALSQIETKEYYTSLLESGIKPEYIKKVGIILAGKKVKVFLK